MIYFASNFLGGQKSGNLNDLITKYNDLKLVKNLDYSSFGILKKRPGTVQVGNTIAASDILGLHDFSKDDGTHKLLAVNATKVYYNNAGTFTDSGITGLTTGKRTRFVNFINRVFLANGTQALKDWDGATTYDNQVTGAPTANYLAVFGDRLYTNSVSSLSTVHYSTIPSAGTISWTAGDFGSYTVQTDDGDIITGIHARRDRLLIFKKHYIEGRDEYFRRVSVVRDIGTPSNDSIVTINNQTYFFNFDDAESTGVYRYGVSEPVKVSGSIQNVFDNELDVTNISKIFAVKYYDNYLLHIPTIANGTKVLCFNVSNEVWSEWTYSYTIKAFTRFYDTGVLVPYLGTNDGKVFKFSGTTDGTTEIVSSIKTFEIHCNKPHIYKDFHNLIFFVNEPTKSSVKYRIDGGDWVDAGVIDKKTTVLGITGAGYNLEIEITDSSKVATEFKGFALEYEDQPNIRKS